MSYFINAADSLYIGNLFLLNEFCKEARTIEFVGRDKTVLEIGCANGRMSKLLRANNCRVTGIELNARLAKMAEPYCEKVIVGNVEDAGVVPADEKFDVILMADLIEHLAYPDELLERLHSALKPGGYLVIAVPNIAYWTMRLHLLLGYFNYSLRGGLLDSTHLRFFTRRTLLEMLAACGYRVDAFYPVPWLLRGERLSRFHWLHPLLWLFNGFLPMLAARALPGSVGNSFVIRAVLQRTVQDV